ncbi:MAG: DUF2586 family protein [Candidatus Glassbacteria bacterium]|nr:DUF2586 family protein [Candidatus Glassbacteria bacterium]
MTFFGDVTHVIVDGAAGLAPPGSPLAIVAGVSDSGTIGDALLIGKEGDFSSLGVGPLVDRLRDIQAAGDKTLNVVAVRVTEIGAGTIGTITETKTGTGTQVASGTPKRFAHVIVIATLDGENGVAKVKVSLDGGKNFTPEEVIPGTGFLVLGDTGVQLDFTDAVPPEDSVDIGDKWEFFITEPTTTLAQTLTDIATALTTYAPSIVYVVGESDPTDWTAAAQEASDRFDAGNPTWFLMESALPDVLTGETLAAWVTARVAEVFEDLWVSVCAGYGRISRAGTNENIRRNVAGVNLGRLASIPVQRSIGRVADGNLTGVELMDDFSNTEAKTLDDKGFTSLRTYNGLAGVYFSNGRMKAAAASDYQFQEIVRVVHKAVSETRVEALTGIQQDVDEVALQSMKGRMERPLDRMTATRPPEILGYLLDIPEGQDVVNNGLEYTLDLEGVPVVRNIKISVRFKFGEVV